MRLFFAISLAAALAAGSPRACETGQTTVSQVYPTGAALPENLLRFYIYFSAPMGQDDILPAIDLLDADGRVMDGVFLSNRFDLWSADRTRLTLVLDPGRVKTGLAANREMGRALVAGETYHLQISKDAKDAQGCPLVAAHRVKFEATNADVSSPTPTDWDLIIPRTGTHAPLTVVLDGTVDHVSLAYRLRVIGADGSPVSGRIDLDAAETRWLFTPRLPWDAYAYQLAIDPLLEDLAGNRMDAVFDLDLGAGGQSMIPSIGRMILFSPKG